MVELPEDMSPSGVRSNPFNDMPRLHGLAERDMPHRFLQSLIWGIKRRLRSTDFRATDMGLHEGTPSSGTQTRMGMMPLSDAVFSATGSATSVDVENLFNTDFTAGTESETAMEKGAPGVLVHTHDVKVEGAIPLAHSKALDRSRNRGRVPQAQERNNYSITIRPRDTARGVMKDDHISNQLDRFAIDPETHPSGGTPWREMLPQDGSARALPPYLSAAGPQVRNVLSAHNQIATPIISTLAKMGAFHRVSYDSSARRFTVESLSVRENPHPLKDAPRVHVVSEATHVPEDALGDESVFDLFTRDHRSLRASMGGVAVPQAEVSQELRRAMLQAAQKESEVFGTAGRHVLGVNELPQEEAPSPSVKPQFEKKDKKPSPPVEKGNTIARQGATKKRVTALEGLANKEGAKEGEIVRTLASYMHAMLLQKQPQRADPSAPVFSDDVAETIREELGVGGTFRSKTALGDVDPHLDRAIVRMGRGIYARYANTGTDANGNTFAYRVNTLLPATASEDSRGSAFYDHVHGAQEVPDRDTPTHIIETLHQTKNGQWVTHTLTRTMGVQDRPTIHHVEGVQTGVRPSAAPMPVWNLQVHAHTHDHRVDPIRLPDGSVTATDDLSGPEGFSDRPDLDMWAFLSEDTQEPVDHDKMLEKISDGVAAGTHLDTRGHENPALRNRVIRDPEKFVNKDTTEISSDKYRMAPGESHHLGHVSGDDWLINPAPMWGRERSILEERGVHSTLTQTKQQAVEQARDSMAAVEQARKEMMWSEYEDKDKDEDEDEDKDEAPSTRRETLKNPNLTGDQRALLGDEVDYETALNEYGSSEDNAYSYLLDNMTDEDKNDPEAWLNLPERSAALSKILKRLSALSDSDLSENRSEGVPKYDEVDIDNPSEVTGKSGAVGSGTQVTAAMGEHPAKLLLSGLPAHVHEFIKGAGGDAVLKAGLEAAMAKSHQRIMSAYGSFSEGGDRSAYDLYNTKSYKDHFQGKTTHQWNMIPVEDKKEEEEEAGTSLLDLATENDGEESNGKKKKRKKRRGWSREAIGNGQFSEGGFNQTHQQRAEDRIDGGHVVHTTFERQVPMSEAAEGEEQTGPFSTLELGVGSLENDMKGDSGGTRTSTLRTRVRVDPVDPAEGSLESIPYEIIREYLPMMDPKNPGRTLDPGKLSSYVIDPTDHPNKANFFGSKPFFAGRVRHTERRRYRDADGTVREMVNSTETDYHRDRSRPIDENKSQFEDLLAKLLDGNLSADKLQGLTADSIKKMHLLSAMARAEEVVSHADRAARTKPVDRSVKGATHSADALSAVRRTGRTVGSSGGGNSELAADDRVERLNAVGEVNHDWRKSLTAFARHQVLREHFSAQTAGVEEPDEVEESPATRGRPLGSSYVRSRSESLFAKTADRVLGKNWIIYFPESPIGKRVHTREQQYRDPSTGEVQTHSVPHVFDSPAAASRAIKALHEKRNTPGSREMFQSALIVPVNGDGDLTRNPVDLFDPQEAVRRKVSEILASPQFKETLDAARGYSPAPMDMWSGLDNTAPLDKESARKLHELVRQEETPSFNLPGGRGAMTPREVIAHAKSLGMRFVDMGTGNDQDNIHPDSHVQSESWLGLDDEHREKVGEAVQQASTIIGARGRLAHSLNGYLQTWSARQSKLHGRINQSRLMEQAMHQLHENIHLWNPKFSLTTFFDRFLSGRASQAASYPTELPKASYAGGFEGRRPDEVPIVPTTLPPEQQVRLRQVVDGKLRNTRILSPLSPHPDTGDPLVNRELIEALSTELSDHKEAVAKKERVTGAVRKTGAKAPWVGPVTKALTCKEAGCKDPSVAVEQTGSFGENSYISHVFRNRCLKHAKMHASHARLEADELSPTQYDNLSFDRAQKAEDADGEAVKAAQSDNSSAVCSKKGCNQRSGTHTVYVVPHHSEEDPLAEDPPMFTFRSMCARHVTETAERFGGVRSTVSATPVK